MPPRNLALGNFFPAPMNQAPDRVTPVAGMPESVYIRQGTACEGRPRCAGQGLFVEG